MSFENLDIIGLSDKEVLLSRKKYGYNIVNYKKQNRVLIILKNLASEPMVLLLLVAASIYFITGNIGDGIFMAAAIILVSTISLYQDSRSRLALEKLKKFTLVKSKVIRNGTPQEIPSSELVKGDFLIIEEGKYINADGIIVHSNDFSINESLLTGESLPVYKDKNKEDNRVYQGTTVTSGLAIAEITEIGKSTKLGRIGESLESIEDEPSPLELQINNFVKKMVVAGAIIFIIVWVLNYLKSHDVLDSLLKALTLAMSILPEEIPVAFTTFMALGAWRLMKMGIVVKEMKTVETLGIATVICADKTGTITENRMTLSKIYSSTTKEIKELNGQLEKDEIELIGHAMWASEPIPFDLMEVALHEAYTNLVIPDRRKNYKMIHEYPLSGEPPMMTHLFENKEGHRIIAAKGAPEALINISKLDKNQINETNSVISELSSQGYRVLGVGVASFNGINFPKRQQDFLFDFKGLVAFHDPPKKNIKSVFEKFYQAGIDVKIVTGDNEITTEAIAKTVGLRGYEENVSGDEIMNMNQQSLKVITSKSNIFYRMFPDAKLKIINTLKGMGQIVAMTGDGINDGPALKAAHIGIAMGKKGTEIAKQSASLILVEDDLSKMVDAVAIGRKIYSNLKKAIRYIISIHIPIILTVSLPLILGWRYPNIFSPVHVILLELIMGPTCSIIYENEPIEEEIMDQKPRQYSTTFFNAKELTVSVIQGLAITIGTLIAYQYAVSMNLNENVTRTMVFTTLISANIFLTLVNRSFIFSFLRTLKYKNPLVPIIISVTILFTLIMLYVPVVRRFFDFDTLTLNQLLICIALGCVSVLWFEIVKWRNRMVNRNTKG